MIENEHQYTVTQSRLAELERALIELREEGPEKVGPDLFRLHKHALRVQIADMTEEVKEYEAANPQPKKIK